MSHVALLFLHALSPLHAGTGQGIGAIDLPIAREKATGIPYLPGSSLKGVLRDRASAWDRDTLFAVFGPDTENASEHAGAVQVGDAKLLLLPVRSLYGVFALVASPYLLERFRREAPHGGPSAPRGSRAPGPHPGPLGPGVPPFGRRGEGLPRGPGPEGPGGGGGRRLGAVACRAHRGPGPGKARRGARRPHGLPPGDRHGGGGPHPPGRRDQDCGQGGPVVRGEPPRGKPPLRPGAGRPLLPQGEGASPRGRLGPLPGRLGGGRGVLQLGGKATVGRGLCRIVVGR